MVSREWLFACAANGTLVRIDKYPVDKSKISEMDNIDGGPLENPTADVASTKEDAQKVNVRNLQEEIPMETSDAASAVQVVNVDKVTDNQRSTRKQPIRRPSIYNRPFRPSFDLADVMEELASPACHSLRRRKSRASRNSFPLDDFFAENIKQTLQKIGTVAPPTREGEDKDDDNDNDATIDDIHQVRERHLS